jgi:spore coat protein A
MTHTAGPATPGDLTRPEVVRREHGLRMFRDPLPVPRVLRPRDGRLTVTMRNAWVSLHSDLPRTRVWAYDGEFPGPTIEVRRGQRLRMEWRNRINGPHPAAATPEPGRDGAEPLPTVAAMPPWNVVHLHGGRTNAGNDGWMENGILPGEAQLSEYLNDQPATALWYHDHPMHVTAYSVFAGLAGMYLVRDDEEDELDLPCGDHEIPLVLCDRNLDTDADGNLTGQLLHKVAGDPGRMLPFMGPFMLVNGKIWPHLDVEPRWYRFRVLNASNARTYRLELRDEAGQPLPGAPPGCCPRPCRWTPSSWAPGNGRTSSSTSAGTAGNASRWPTRSSSASPSPCPPPAPTSWSSACAGS